MFNPDAISASLFLPSLETEARSLKVVLITAPVRSDAEIETAIIALGRGPGGGLVVLSGGLGVVHRARSYRRRLPRAAWAGPQDRYCQRSSPLATLFLRPICRTFQGRRLAEANPDIGVSSRGCFGNDHGKAIHSLLSLRR